MDRYETMQVFLRELQTNLTSGDVGMAISHLYNRTQQVQCSSKCARVPRQRHDLINLLCGTLVPHFALLALWSLLAFVACAASGVCGVMLVKRLFLSAQVAPQDDAEGSGAAFRAIHVQGTAVGDIFTSEKDPTTTRGGRRANGVSAALMRVVNL